LASPDFYLFRAIKRKMAGSEFGSTEELLSEVTDITNLISHTALAGVFRESGESQQKCTDMEGDHVD
jgi:hypothetical protein